MKELELKFVNQKGSVVTYRLDNPIEPIDPEVINAAMDEILNQNVFWTNGGELVEKHSARIVETNIEEIEL